MTLNRSTMPGRSDSRALQSRRRILSLAVAGLAAMGAAACGKKGDPAYPEDTIPGAPRARRDESKVYPD